MKRLLFLSILLNLTLAGTSLWLAQNRKGTPESSAEESARKEQAHSVQATPVPQGRVFAQAFDWRAVESEDYKIYITNLRAIGCPEETIRDIIIADVNKLYESRQKELRGSTNKFQFWKAGNMFAEMMDPNRLAQVQELNREKRALLKELLGVEPEIPMMDMFAAMNPFEGMLDFLSGTKQSETMEIYAKYQAQLANAFGSGVPGPEEIRKLQKMQQEMDAELAGILTPQEFEEYQLRMSMTAMTMRMQLASFDPTEQEFRDVFRIRKAFDDQYSIMGMPLPNAGAEERERMAQARSARDEQLKEVLQDRYPDYQRAQDWNYQQIARVAEGNGLPKEAAVKVYDMKAAAEDQARRIRQDTSLTPEQRSAALGSVRLETERAMQTVMGDQAYRAYQNQATWLRRISPDPAAGQ